MPVSGITHWASSSLQPLAHSDRRDIACLLHVASLSPVPTIKIQHINEITLGSVWVMRYLCLESCSLNRAALTNGTDCRGNPPPDCMPVAMHAVSASVYVLLITSASLWSIVTFWQLSRRKLRRRPRTLGRAFMPPLSWMCNKTKHAIDHSIQLENKATNYSRLRPRCTLHGCQLITRPNNVIWLILPISPIMWKHDIIHNSRST